MAFDTTLAPERIARHAPDRSGATGHPGFSGYWYLDGYPGQRYLRTSRDDPYEGISQIHTLTIGKALTALKYPRSGP